LAGEGGLSINNPLGLNRVSCGSGFGEETSIEWVGVMDMLEGGAIDTGVSKLSGNWNFKTLNSRCRLIEVCQW
jgi:hypothetical protein